MWRAKSKALTGVEIWQGMFENLLGKISPAHWLRRAARSNSFNNRRCKGGRSRYQKRSCSEGHHLQKQNLLQTSKAQSQVSTNQSTGAAAHILPVFSFYLLFTVEETPRRCVISCHVDFFSNETGEPQYHKHGSVKTPIAEVYSWITVLCRDRTNVFSRYASEQMPGFSMNFSESLWESMHHTATCTETLVKSAQLSLPLLCSDLQCTEIMSDGHMGLSSLSLYFNHLNSSF